ncbi:tetratricopeptide repeat protein [Phenylobacterium deserti]|uniref:Uncharacterized protein n=1 Tax=Phenylobacterium deserti TaxID=1914756 RepID=A0A328AH92_9CAUL|nr:tetratricopeptide repeat protein [Phenylobacterium deserti]RAK52734.1 hypothetical protein DJ018_11130 [Phenylobacterium deserti]
MATAAQLHDQATEWERAGDLEAALQAYVAASEADPLSGVLKYNAGNIQRRLKRFTDAQRSYSEALALTPNLHMARFMRATCLLQTGDLFNGFRELEARKDCPGFDDVRYGLPRQWAGEPIADKRLFVYPEWFQGDLMQFGRFALLAQMAGARVILAAPPPMHAILRTMSADIELIDAEAVPERYDFASALMSLPAGFGTRLDTVPRGVYLHADQQRIERWRAHIGSGGLKIGIVWQGSALAADRSVPLSAMEPLTRVPGARLISLQKGGGLDQLPDLPQVETLGDDFDSGPDLFVDTAAAAMSCDVVVSADTSVAHLAGALGVRTLVALPWLGDWRWLEGRSDTPWYPTMALFRQATPGDWRTVFEQMADTLADPSC